MCNISFRRLCQEWRLWIRPLLILSYGIFAIIVVPLLIVNSVKDGFSRRDQLILIGGLFVLSAVPVSIFHIIQHTINFTKPILQKHIIRILWMVPIYACNAWIGLWFPKHSIYVDSLRECYEAYVIYNFMIYLLNYLNLGMDLEATMEFKPQVYHFFPLCCIRPWTMGREFIHNCKHGILQYTVVRPITTFISVICELSGVYGEGTFSGDVAFPYIVVINNISQFVAMYCLVLFYRANKEDLKPMKPIPKFLCIKAVVFFSFFQGVLLNILVYYGYIKDVFGSTVGNDVNLASMLQNFLICIEMFIAAVAHIYSFPHHPFHINSPQYWNNQGNNWYRAFLSMIDISDMQEDVTEHLGVVSSSITRRFQGRSSYQPLSRGPRRTSSESEYLINKRQDSATSSGGDPIENSDQHSTSTGKTNQNSKRNYFISTSSAVTNKNQPPPHTRYGATDSLVLPVHLEEEIIHDSQSHLAAGMMRPTTSNSATFNTAMPDSNIGNVGIGIQKRETSYNRDHLHYGAPSAVLTGESILQARNVGNTTFNTSNPIPEYSDEFASFIGGGSGTR